MTHHNFPSLFSLHNRLKVEIKRKDTKVQKLPQTREPTIQEVPKRVLQTQALKRVLHGEVLGPSTEEKE